MKPAKFAYARPSSMPEALGLLAQLGDTAKILAGGQSLIPAMNFRSLRPQHLIDINGLSGLEFIRQEAGDLVLGALVRHRTIERHPLISRMIPLMPEAAAFIGYPAIRNRGTFAGSLANADPAAEWPTVAIALDARCVVASAAGERVVPVDDLIVGPMTTSLRQDELITEVRVPVPAPEAGQSFLEISRRYGGPAIAAVAAIVEADPAGRIRMARIAYAGLGPRAIRARSAELLLSGELPTEPLLREAANIAANETDPTSDIHASADYRRHVAAVLCRRALEHSVERAGAGRLSA